MKKILRYMQETGGHIQLILILVGCFPSMRVCSFRGGLKAADGFNLLDAVLGVRLGTCIKDVISDPIS
jgi:hypothetical protein